MTGERVRNHSGLGRTATGRVVRGRVGAFLAAIGVGVVLVLVSPSSAAFAGPYDGTPNPPPPENHEAVVNRCVLYANQSGFGADCVGGESGMTIKQILHGEKFPECRFEPLTDDVTPPSTHDGETGTWYLKDCLKGIKDDGTGDFTRTIEFAWIPAGTDVPVLTPNQTAAWKRYRSAYPDPTPQFGPAAQPRVLIPTYFWLTAKTGSAIEHTVWDGTREVLMRAHVEGIYVTPGGYKDNTRIHCPGPVLPYNHARGIFDQDSNCSYEYKRSSAVATDKKFDVIVEAEWVVEYQLADGRMQMLGRIPLTRVALTAVDEIQTVVG